MNASKACYIKEVQTLWLYHISKLPHTAVQGKENSDEYCTCYEKTQTSSCVSECLLFVVFPSNRDGITSSSSWCTWNWHPLVCCRAPRTIRPSSCWFLPSKKQKILKQKRPKQINYGVGVIRRSSQVLMWIEVMKNTIVWYTFTVLPEHNEWIHFG